MVGTALVQTMLHEAGAEVVLVLAVTASSVARPRRIRAGVPPRAWRCRSWWRAPPCSWREKSGTRTPTWRSARIRSPSWLDSSGWWRWSARPLWRAAGRAWRAARRVIGLDGRIGRPVRASRPGGPRARTNDPV